MISSKSEQHTHILDLARQTLDIEAQAILAVKQHLGEQFVQAVQAVLAVKGRVVVMGMGKSGHIGRKIAATLASTGTPAFLSIPPKQATGIWAWLLGMIW